MKCHKLWARASCVFAILVVSSAPLHAQNTATTGTTVGLPSIGSPPHITPSPLLAIDQHRASVVDRIVREWGDSLRWSNDAGITHDQLREMLMGLRADHLLAASLAGSLTGLRDVLAQSLTASTAAKPTLFQTKALGDAADDLVYTPVSPCRLFDTRPSQGGLGVMTPNVRRTYGATTPVANQGGPGACNAPVGAAVALIQIGSLTPSGNGYLQGGAQGVASFPNALILYQAGDQYGTAIAMPLNIANGRFDLQVQFAATDLYGDLLGYFKAPGGPGSFVQGGNAFGTTGFLGTTDNQALEIRVNNSRVMRYEPNAISPNVIGGSPANGVTAGVRGATIAGGGVPSGDTDPDYAFEAPNHVFDHYGVIGGGYANVAGSFNGTLTDAPFATVGGGRFNISSASASTIGGGRENIASGNNSTVAGGYANHANGTESVVGGGISNTAGGEGSTVAGGESNTASGSYGTVAGGIGNTAGGYGTVAGGFGNTANGIASFAAGNVANANNDGCFVWGDDSTTNEVNCGGVANRFVVRAEGGVYFFAGFTGTNDQAGYKGVVLPPGAQAWTATSDRAGKDNLAPVDARDVLRKIAAMPIATWNWKSQDVSIRHMGPMAQDFHAAFGLGETPKGISTIDADGVALAAIQGLHQLDLEKDVRIASQDEKISALERTVADLKRAVEALVKH